MPPAVAKALPAESIQLAPIHVPTFLLRQESWLGVFFGNFAELFRKPPRVVLTARPATFWKDVFVATGLPHRGFSLSAVYHAGFFAFLSMVPNLLLLSEQPVLVEKQHTTLTYYNVSEYLPPINPAKRPAPAKTERKPDPAYSPQPIISVHQSADNFEQTVVDPSSVKLNRHAPLPNLVVSTPVPAPPVAALERAAARLTLPTLAPEVIQPAPEATSRKTSQLQLPAQPLPAIIEPAPLPDSMQRKLGDINVARLEPDVQAPKLPVAEQRAATANPENVPSGSPQEEVSPPALPASSAGGGEKAVGQVVALGLNPALPNGPITIPGGNRHGEFAATPEGRVGASGAPESTTSANHGAGQSAEAGNHSGIYVAGGPQNPGLGAVVAKPLPKANLLASLSTPSVSELARQTRPGGVADPDRIEDEVFAGKRYYSLTLNMPNLTSASGSWVVRFAELNPTPMRGDLTAPVATDKVDPAYPAELMRSGVEGTVFLYAVIHSDGTVGEVRVLRGFDDRLDENARLALSRWHFRPATKNGEAVALEAVVQIPFRARKIY